MADEQARLMNQGERTQQGLIDVLWQVGDLVKKVYGLEIEALGDGQSFRSRKTKNQRKGVASVAARLEDEPIVRVKLEWLRTSVDTNPSLDSLWKKLSELSEGVRPLPPTQDSPSGTTSYWLELKVQATTPLGLSRKAVLSAELEAIDALAASVQSELPRPQSTADLDRLYADHLQLVKPIYSPEFPSDQSAQDLSSWADTVQNLLSSSLNVAVSTDSPVLQDIALAAVAEEIMKSGGTLGMVQPPMLNPKNVIEIAKQAPGKIVVPASRISLGTSPYEMGDQIQSLLSVLSSSGTPVIFIGTQEQLQTTFHGGQGGTNDPLLPVVLHAPAVPFGHMVRFALQAAARQYTGISDEKLLELQDMTFRVLSPLPESERSRLLPAAAAHGVAHRNSHVYGTERSIATFVQQIAGMSETLAGLSQKPRARRRERVQQNLVSRLLGSELLTHFTSELLAQDRALEQLVYRLQTECLTRSDHQPIRYCVQGTPGTGKSESAAMLARFLNVPHINIDAASQPDYYTASAQLLGSGRGIVGSYEAGKLEKAAKHSAGAVIEISDLDHAPTSVRGHLADLFLQVLDTGEAQSATGAMFSCANLIFAFTINLPEGRDEHLYRGIGFDGTRSRSALLQYVEAEIKTLFSNAFLSRIGRPILFSPLSGSDLALIAEREMCKALNRGLGIIGVSADTIELPAGIGLRIVESLDSGLLSHGARVVAEHARLLVTRALLPHIRSGKQCQGKKLAVRLEANSEIAITFCD